MNVYDTANKLAKEIKESKEYIDYKNIKEELDKNLEVKAKISEFEKARYEVQLEELKGEEGKKEQLEKMQKMYMDLIKIDLAKRYFDIELKFNVLLADVNKIIGESVQDIIQ